MEGVIRLEKLKLPFAISAITIFIVHLLMDILQAIYYYVPYLTVIYAVLYIVMTAAVAIFFCYTGARILLMLRGNETVRIGTKARVRKVESFFDGLTLTNLR